MSDERKLVERQLPSGGFQFVLPPLRVRYIAPAVTGAIMAQVLMFRIPLHTQITDQHPIRVRLFARFTRIFLSTHLPSVLSDLLMCYL